MLDGTRYPTNVLTVEQPHFSMLDGTRYPTNVLTVEQPHFLS